MLLVCVMFPDLPRLEEDTYSEAAAAAANLLQSCLTLCDPIDSSPLGSSVPGILQARGLEWGAVTFSTLNVRVTLKQNKRHPTEEIMVMRDYGPVSHKLTS